MSGTTSERNIPSAIPLDASKRPVLSRPETSIEPVRVKWNYAIGIPLIHGVALLALFPYFFSWTGVVLAVLGLYVFGTLGINLCYHRMLTHQGLTCPKWFERTLAVLGVCCMQDTPGRWVATHRLHHQHSDERPDPHSPLVTFFWGHFGWLLVENREFRDVNVFERFVRDILRDPFYLRLEVGFNGLLIYFAHAAIFLVLGTLAGLLTTSTYAAAIQFGLSCLIWGVFVRTVATWHITWSVNSVTHIWGYRNYETGDNSRNSILIGLLSNGEGWHNNHHADQRAAAHGHRWWELDVTWLTIRLLERIGLVHDVVRPKAWQTAK